MQKERKDVVIPVLLHIASLSPHTFSARRISLSLLFFCTACGHRIAHRKCKETKLQPGTAGPGNRLGCCLISFHFLWTILCLQAVPSIH